MENPEREIPYLIHQLTQAPPSEQKAALHKYFTPTASITHPFCRTGSWTLDTTLAPFYERFGIKEQEGGINSRWLVARIYRWYKIMSPRIGARVDGVAVEYEPSGDDEGSAQANGNQDRKLRAAYATVRQSFGIFFWPFYRADVRLIVRLGLTYDNEGKKYYVTSQEDCYPFHEFTRFIWFGIWRLVILLQIFGTAFCTIFSYIVFPVTTWAERNQIGSAGELSENGWNVPKGHGLEVMGNHLHRKGKKENKEKTPKVK